jgi:hypothetical protein
MQLLFRRRGTGTTGASTTSDRIVRSRAVAALAVAALCVSGGIATAADAEPAADDATAAQPGEIVSAEPSSFQVLPGVPTPTDAWKIQYASTDASGKPNTVSGTVLVPKDDREGPRPLITYAVGTVGIGDQCAPSANFPTGKTT